MKQTSPLTTFIAFLKQLPDEKFFEYLNATIFVIALSIIGCFSYIRSQSNSLIHKIQLARELSLRAEELIESHNELAIQEQKLSQLLESRPDYSGLKGYFEQFCKTHSATPESGWAETTHSIESGFSEQFEEEQLNATFKKLSTKSMVTLIDALEKDELLTLREVEITHENPSLTARFTVSAKRFRTSLLG